MENAKQITDDLMFRLKTSTMQLFEIKREVGPNWLPIGYVPFDIRAGNGVATFSVYAEFLQDAEDQVTTWLENMEKDNE
jgi:hypothetical protein